MHKQDDTQQAAELRLAFVRHLPKRLETLRKRGLRLCTQGWDINALSILFRELQTLAGACGRYGLLDVGERLFAMENFLAPFVQNVAIPNVAQTEAFTMQLAGLDLLIAQHEERHIEPAVTQAASTTTLKLAEKAHLRHGVAKVKATVTVKVAGGGVATGTVRVVVKGKTYTATLANGTAHLRLKFKKAKKYAVTATYAGTTQVLGSQSPKRTIKIRAH